VSLIPFLALASALLSALAAIFIRQGLRGSDPNTGVWINIAVGAAGLWIAVAFNGGLGPVTWQGVMLFALAGLVGTVGGRMSRFAAIEKVGASITSSVGNLTPLIASILAIALLGERVTLPVVLGTIVIVAGTVLLSLSGARLGFRPWMIALPLVSATCFGIVQIIRKVALGDVGPVSGAAINTTTAFLAFSLVMLVTRNRGLSAIRGRALVYLIAAGVTENAGVFILILALSYGSVSVVTPLMGATPLFVLLLTPIMLRGVEVLTARVVTGSLLIVLGVYLVSAFGAG